MITPLPFGGGDGGGAIIFLKPCVFCSSVFSVRKNISFLICHYVILSYKNHQFLSVTLLFCLQKSICFSPSLCYSVFKKPSVSLSQYVILSSKKTSVSLCHYVILFSKKTSVSLSHSVILSENAPVGDGSGPNCCCYCYVSFCLISIFHKLCYVLLHYFSLIYSF